MPNTLLQAGQEQAARMDALQALRKKHADTARSALQGARDQNREMTDDERASFDASEAAALSVIKTIEIEERAAKSAWGNIPTDSPAAHRAVEVRENILDKPWVQSASTDETRERRLRRVSQGFGEYLSLVANAQRLREAGHHSAVDPRLLDLNEQFAKRAAPAGASEMVPSDGGFLIAPDFAEEILVLAHNTGIVYPRTRQLPLSEFTNAVKIPAVDEQSRKDGSRFGGIQMFWENEAQSLTGSKPGFALLEMVTKKLTGLFYSTNELLADSRLLGMIAMLGFSQELGFKLDDGVIRGTGNGQLSGILNAKCLVTVAKETSQTATTVVWENIKKMWGRMWAPSRQNAVWFINQDVEQQLYGMGQVVGVGGVPVYLPPTGAAGQPYATLFGRPVIPIEQASTLGTAGDVILADFSQYIMLDKGALQTASSMHVRFVTDEMTYRFIYRTDGQSWWKTALTPANGTNTLSPFVVCAAR